MSLPGSINGQGSPETENEESLKSLETESTALEVAPDNGSQSINANTDEPDQEANICKELLPSPDITATENDETDKLCEPPINGDDSIDTNIQITEDNCSQSINTNTDGPDQEINNCKALLPSPDITATENDETDKLCEPTINGDDSIYTNTQTTEDTNTNIEEQIGLLGETMNQTDDTIDTTIRRVNEEAEQEEEDTNTNIEEQNALPGETMSQTDDTIDVTIPRINGETGQEEEDTSTPIEMHIVLLGEAMDQTVDVTHTTISPVNEEVEQVAEEINTNIEEDIVLLDEAMNQTGDTIDTIDTTVPPVNEEVEYVEEVTNTNIEDQIAFPGEAMNQTDDVTDTTDAAMPPVNDEAEQIEEDTNTSIEEHIVLLGEAMNQTDDATHTTMPPVNEEVEQVEVQETPVESEPHHREVGQVKVNETPVESELNNGQVEVQETPVVESEPHNGEVEQVEEVKEPPVDSEPPNGKDKGGEEKETTETQESSNRKRPSEADDIPNNEPPKKKKKADTTSGKRRRKCSKPTANQKRTKPAKEYIPLQPSVPDDDNDGEGEEEGVPTAKIEYKDTTYLHGLLPLDRLVPGRFDMSSLLRDRKQYFFTRWNAESMELRIREVKETDLKKKGIPVLTMPSIPDPSDDRERGAFVVTFCLRKQNAKRKRKEATETGRKRAKPNSYNDAPKATHQSTRNPTNQTKSSTVSEAAVVSTPIKKEKKQMGVVICRPKPTFATLPLIILEEIYRKLLVADNPIRVHGSWTVVYQRQNLNLFPAILSVSKSNYIEAIRVLYGQNTFHYVLRDASIELAIFKGLEIDDHLRSDDIEDETESEWEEGENNERRARRTTTIRRHKNQGRRDPKLPKQDINLKKVRHLFRNIIIEAEQGRYSLNTQKMMTKVIQTFAIDDGCKTGRGKAFRSKMQQYLHLSSIIIRVTPLKFGYREEQYTFLDFFSPTSPIMAALHRVPCSILRFELLTPTNATTARAAQAVVRKGNAVTMNMNYYYTHLQNWFGRGLADPWPHDKAMLAYREQKKKMAQMAYNVVKDRLINIWKASEHSKAKVEEGELDAIVVEDDDII